MTAKWGNATALLGEGIAVHLAGWQGRDPDEWVKEFAAEGRLPEIKNMVSTLDFRTLDDTITYPVAGSWVKGLVEAHGIKKLRSLYKKTSPIPSTAEFSKLMKDVYGFGFEEYTREWKEKLGI